MSEGGNTAAPAYRVWFDYYGLAIPGDSQGAPGGQPLEANFQYLLGAVGAGAAQNDILNQESGWSDTTPSTPPNTTGSPAYGGIADSFLTTCSAGVHDNDQCGFGPTAGKALETRDGTTSAGNSVTPDSITHGDGTPWSLAQLAEFNNSNGQASGYNLQRGPILEVPLSAFSISIVFNATNLTIPSGGVKLSRNSLCGIEQGLITNWNDPSITSDNGGQTIGNQPISVVYRNDGAGTTFVLSYGLYVICSQSNVQPGNVWTQGVGTNSELGPVQGGPPPNTVVWPSTAIGEKGNGGVASEVNSVAGTIGYVGTSYVSKSGGHEAYIQNQAGNFENATVANIQAAIASGPFVKANQTNEIPPNFPFIKNAYLPLPSAATAAPFVSYDFGYFYSCYPERQLNQISALHAVYKWALTKDDGANTPADTILQANALVQLPDKAPKTGGAAKNTSQSTIAGLGVYPASHSGSYTDPTTGNTLPYTCTPLQ